MNFYNTGYYIKNRKYQCETKNLILALYFVNYSFLRSFNNLHKLRVPTNTSLFQFVYQILPIDYYWEIELNYTWQSMHVDAYLIIRSEVSTCITTQKD